MTWAWLQVDVPDAPRLWLAASSLPAWGWAASPDVFVADMRHFFNYGLLGAGRYRLYVTRTEILPSSYNIALSRMDVGTNAYLVVMKP